MTGRMMTLAAGFALIGAPHAGAQETPAPDAPKAEQAEREGRAEGAERAERGKRAGHAARAERMGVRRDIVLDRTIGRLMDRRYEVGLSDDQMSRLGTLRREAATALAPIRGELAAVREGLRDGTLTRQQARERLEAVHERAGEQDGVRDRLDEILEPEQRQLLRRGTGRRAVRKRPDGRERRQPGR